MHVSGRTISPAVLGRFAVALAVAFAVTAFPAQAHAASAVRLMVDPGHGGSDPGAEDGGLAEKDSNLRISKLVEDSARRQGWNVSSTRNDDRFVGLVERPQAAGAWKANAFVSVHSNSIDAKPRGSMTIYRSAAGGRLGASIMRELDPLTPYPDIGNRSDVRGLAVLRAATMPSTLVELLSVSSGVENRALKSPVQQRRMAEAIVRGIARYFNVKYYPPAIPKPAPRPAPAPKAAPTTPVTSTPVATPTAAPAATPKAEPVHSPKADPLPASATPQKPEAAPKVTPALDRTPKAAPAPERTRQQDTASSGVSVVAFVWHLLFK